MSKITKRMRIIHKHVNIAKQYDIHEAITLMKELSKTKFIESVDVAVNLGINTRNPEQNIRGTVVLPHGTGRCVRIAVFAQDSDAEAAKAAGAEIVGMEDLAEHIKKGTLNFDCVVSSLDAMHIVSKLGPFLGPRGLMPNPKMGTVTSNIFDTVKNIKIGQVHYRNDKNGIIHITIGKVNFETDKLKENFEAFLIALKKKKPIQVKGIFIKKISISSTMGVSFTLNRVG